MGKTPLHTPILQPHFSPRTEARGQGMVVGWRNPTALRHHNAVDGRNSILSDLEQTGAVNTLPRTGSVENDLRRLFDQWSSGKHTVVVRTRVTIQDVVGSRGSSHIARLWALDEVKRVCRMGDSRLYEDAGLKLVDPSSVPSTVPEPATWVVLTAGILALIGIRRKPNQEVC